MTTNLKMETQQKIKKNANERQKKKSKEAIDACFRFATKVTGLLIRSENSLNQHIKLKHPELWSKYKHAENNNSDGLIEAKNNDNEDKKSE